MMTIDQCCDHQTQLREIRCHWLHNMQSTDSELVNISIVRKSLVASRPIRIGESFTADNMTVKRPGTGISPMDWDAWIGRKATRNFSEDDLIQ